MDIIFSRARVRSSQGRLVVGTAARVRIVLPHPATVAVGGVLTATLEVLAADGTPFSAHQVRGAFRLSVLSLLPR